MDATLALHQLPRHHTEDMTPDLPGRVLVSEAGQLSTDGMSFNPDGRCASLGSRDGLRFFDLESASELEVVPAGCSASGTRWSRFIGPWIGDSSIAVHLSCGKTSRLFVRDLASGESLDVVVPGTVEPFGLVADFDFPHYDRPANAWFTMCACHRRRRSERSRPVGSVRVRDRWAIYRGCPRHPSCHWGSRTAAEREP